MCTLMGLILLWAESRFYDGNTYHIFVYLSFAVLVASLHREFVQHSQQVEGLLWLEGEQVEIHQQEAHRLCKLFF